MSGQRYTPEFKDEAVKQVIDSCKLLLGQLLVFQQSAKLQQGGGIRGLLHIQISTNKVTNGHVVVNLIFNAFIGQTKALLGDVHAKHGLEPLAAVALGHVNNSI